MNELGRHAAAMKRKRWSFGALVVVLAVGGLAVYLEWLGGMGIPLAWVGLIAGGIAANRLLACPACGQRLGSLFERVCSRCGAQLAHDASGIPVKAGPLDFSAVEYMTRSREILQRWARWRKKWGSSVYLVGPAVAAVMMVVLYKGDFVEAIVVGLVVGACAGMLAWLILTQVIDNVFGLGFFFLRGKCPRCRKRFNPPTSFGPASVETDYSLPRFCGACGVNLE